MSVLSCCFLDIWWLFRSKLHGRDDKEHLIDLIILHAFRMWMQAVSKERNGISTRTDCCMPRDEQGRGLRLEEQPLTIEGVLGCREDDQEAKQSDCLVESRHPALCSDSCVFAWITQPGDVTSAAIASSKEITEKQNRAWAYHIFLIRPIISTMSHRLTRTNFRLRRIIMWSQF